MKFASRHIRESSHKWQTGETREEALRPFDRLTAGKLRAGRREKNKRVCVERTCERSDALTLYACTNALDPGVQVQVKVKVWATRSVHLASC